MIKKPVNKKYISHIDQMLIEFDRTHINSSAIIAEINKHARVFQLRDHATPPQKDKDMWDFNNS